MEAEDKRQDAGADQEARPNQMVAEDPNWVVVDSAGEEVHRGCEGTFGTF